jgi:hypothetical protein
VGDPDRYASAWNELITWRRRFGGFFLGWLPVNALAMIALGVSCSGVTANRVMPPLALITTVPLVFAALRSGR